MKIESAFLCDDVRQEGNGKLMFIGSYSQDILSPTFPVGLKLHGVLCVRFDEPSTFDLEVEVFIDDLLQLKGILGVNNTVKGFGFLQFPILLQNIERPGKLKVQVRKKEETWDEVINVDLKPSNPSPTGPSQPS